MYNIKIAFRNLYHNGVYSMINLIGLAVSLTVIVIIVLWVENELTFNRWYTNSNRLFVAGVSDHNSSLLKGSEPLLKALCDEFPEVKRVSHFLDQDVTLSTMDNNMTAFKESGAFVDSTIFNMLDIKMVRGNAQSVFQSAFPIVLSEKLATKIFGKNDPIGKVLIVNNYEEQYEVAGIFKEQPQNSSFRFQWLMPFTVHAKRWADKGWNPENDWGTTWFQCCVELQPKIDITALNEKLRDIEKVRRNGSSRRDIFLYPISQLHLYGEFENGKPIAGKIVQQIREFSIIAIIILLIACINFVNLTTARAERRMMEMGVRKTFGANRRNLIWLLMRESAILILSSLVLATVITLLVLPLLNRFWNVNLSLYLWDIRHLCGLLLIGIVSVILSGGYPSFYLSAFNANDIIKKLKNRSSYSGVAWIRKGLIVFQYTVSCILISFTIAVFMQIRHGQQRPMGFDKENLLRVSPLTSEMASKFLIFREELVNSGLITSAALSQDPLISFGSSSTGFRWHGQHPDINPTIYRSSVSPGYFNTVGLKLLEGRDFYEGNETDTRSVIINKTLAEMMSDEGKVNSVLWQEEQTNAVIYTIIGIIDDHICDDIYKAKSEPLMLHKGMGRQQAMPNLFIRFKSQYDAGDVLKKTQNTLSQFAADVSLEYFFMDDMINRLFDKQRMEGGLVALFSILSVIISCLGLFGLVTYIAESKTKEIGIRRILGASVGNIVEMLTKEFLILVTISVFIAIPLAYYWINQMLQNYGYRISVSWEIFAITMLITMALTMLTIGWLVWKTAKANPVKSLKTE